MRASDLHQNRPGEQRHEPVSPLLELARPFSLLLSILSLYPLLLDAFFVLGTRWQERLMMALLRAGFAGCVCCASGLVFCWPEASLKHMQAALPVRLFF